MSNEDTLLDYRARTERLRMETEQRRQRALSDQCDPGNAPDMRVRIWERLHQVQLPKSPSHAILVLVARQTGLDLPAVLEVQRLRAEA